MRREMKIMLLMASFCFVLSIGSIFAYFTATDANTNTFVVGNISIDMEEPSWDQTNAVSIEPGKMIAKDPVISNTGVNPAFIFAEIIIPKRNIYTYDPVTRARNEKADTTLFSLNNIGTGWALVKTDNTEEGQTKYIYTYGSQDACSSLAAGTSAPAVFDSISYCYAVEGQGLEDIDNGLIVVKAYGIQADNITSEDTKDPETIWNILNKQIEKEESPAEDDEDTGDGE